MTKTKVRIPVGVESFEKIRTTNCYYIDKTKFIAELLDKSFSVNLITRPRRFGKTLMMSMLESFFDIRKDSKALFEGLQISKDTSLCNTWMNQCPVLFLSLKDIARMEFDKSFAQLQMLLSDLCKRHSYLLKSEQVDEDDKERFCHFIRCEASETEVENSLFILMRMMYAHYEKTVILLIDEYDVPLAKANEYGYYKEMLDVIRGIMSTALKTNSYLNFAVITGCLRIAKESIFTGTNHFLNSSIDGESYMDSFGFTKEEVEALLKEVHLETHFDEIKEWYNGYHFGKYDIYCPWDVVNHVSVLMDNPNRRPENYWKDTSHNNIIRNFIKNQNVQVNEKFELLLSGASVLAQIKDDLTYDFEHSTEDNFWSILYLTGYLTKEREYIENGMTRLIIPNEEVKTIFADTIVEWFKDTMRVSNRVLLMESLWLGREEEVSAMISKILRQTISYHNYKEDYYHAFLAGIFIGLGYLVESDREHGEGRPDVVVKDILNERVIIFEVKHSQSVSNMEKDCWNAVNQIATRKYVEDFLDDYDTVVCYGIAFFKKRCLLKKIDLNR